MILPYISITAGAHYEFYGESCLQVVTIFRTLYIFFLWFLLSRTHQDLIQTSGNERLESLELESHTLVSQMLLSIQLDN